MEVLMNRVFSIQFNFGVAGIISSIIWILTKFGFFNLTTNEWLSLTFLIISFAAFYYYLNVMNDRFVLLSMFMFFTSIALLIYSFESSNLNNRSAFSFEFLYYAFAFALTSFFLIKSFYLNPKTNLAIAFILFVFALTGIFGFQASVSLIKSSKAFSLILKLKEVGNYLINICLILLIFFPVKNLISEIKTKKLLQ